MSDERVRADLGNETDAILDELDSLKALLDHELEGTTEKELEELLDQELSDVEYGRQPSSSLRSFTPTSGSVDPASKDRASPIEIPILEEVVVDGEAFTRESRSPPVLEPLETPSAAPTIAPETLEYLIDTLIERELPRLREELKARIIAELERLLPQLKD